MNYNVEKYKKRIEWIDVAKGIGIILVIFGHIKMTNPIFKEWLYTFHMPLFFFLSGVVFNYEKYKGFKELLKSKIYAVIIPYFFLYIFNLGFRVINELTTGNNWGIVVKNTLGLFINIRNTNYGAGVWYLTAIFSTYILGYLIIKFGKVIKSKSYKSAYIYICGILLGLALIGFCYAKFIHKTLPWAIDAAVIGTIYFLVGYYYKDKMMKLKWKNIYYVYSIILIGISVALFHFNTQVDMWGMEYGNNIIVFVLNSFVGIVLTILISMIIHNKLIKDIGVKSIYIYGMHVVIVKILEKIYNKLGFDNTWFRISYVILSVVLICLVGIYTYSYFEKIVKKSTEVIEKCISRLRNREKLPKVD